VGGAGYKLISRAMYLDDSMEGRRGGYAAVGEVECTRELLLRLVLTIGVGGSGIASAIFLVVGAGDDDDDDDATSS
jgi:hypothetical protein